MISSVGYGDRTSKLFQKHKLLKLFDINNLQIAHFVFNYYNHALPTIFSSYYYVNHQIHHNNTRASNKLHQIRFECNVRFYCL